MAQNITLLGASYSDVPSVELPKTGGGTAQFDDTTIASNAASASDITSGKLAFVNGELVTGTASGGGATLITKSITANGTYNASSDNADGYSSVTVNVSGGGGLEYETGTWTPVSDIARGTISFADSHSSPPIFFAVADMTGTNVPNASSIISCIFGNWYGAFGYPAYSSNSGAQYGAVRFSYGGISSGSQTLSSLTGETNAALSYWATSGAIYPYANSDTRYWKSGRTYKWFAVWTPSS